MMMYLVNGKYTGQNALLIATDGIIWTNTVPHNSGVGVSFVRDNLGHVSQIIAPNGNATQRPSVAHALAWV